MTRLLILGMRGDCRNLMVEAFARLLASSDTDIKSAAIDPQPPCSEALTVIDEFGLAAPSADILPFGQLGTTSSDIVLAIGRQAASYCSVLPGAVAAICWELSRPDVSGDKDFYHSQLHQLCTQIEVKVTSLFRDGYIDSIMALRHKSRRILDCLSDGILAHDGNRVITCFNSAAERITGYRREEVIGRNCPDVFEGGFCGSQCQFTTHPPFDHIKFPMKVATKDGRQRQVEASAIGMKNEQGGFQGIILSFHDITEVSQLRRTLRTVQSFHGIIGRDEKMQRIYELIGDLSVSDCPVLIQGESGTGKELVAGAIHGESRRANRQFVTVNCGALPEGILESELFGHVRGAFTGAIRDKKGRFELADGGTIFLDEIAELTPNMQVKLLRVLQEGTFEPVGGEKTISTDIRIISATNKDLSKMVPKGLFREDLYYRLRVMPIDLPPLRRRRNDIPLLTNHFIKKLGKDIGRQIRSISPEAMPCMVDYDWPGNVRELQNSIQYAFIKCKEGTIETKHLPPEILSHFAKQPGTTYHRRGKLTSLAVGDALEKTGGNKLKAAELLGVGRATLYRFLKEDWPQAK